MIMFGLEFTGKIPFDTIYLHGLIHDENGQKMSKTKGNVVDPLIVMDELGTDALRFTLLVGSTPGNDMNLSIKKVEANRNFANKIWNAGRFVINTLNQAPKTPEKAPEWTLADSWIWARLQSLIAEVEHLFASQQYGEAGRQIYDFFWGEFADWYIEIAKLQFAEGGDRAFYTAKVLVQVFDSCLRLLHPFTPFVTEALWGHLKQTCIENFSGYHPAEGWTDALMVAAWPVSNPREGWEEQKIADFILIQEMVRAIRNLRRIAASIAAGDKWNIINENIKVIASLAGLDENQIILKSDLAEKPLDQTALIVMGIEIYLALSDVVDAPAEQARLEKELAIATDQINRLEALLNSSFAQKAPAQVVEKERQKLAGFQETAQKIREQLT